MLFPESLRKPKNKLDLHTPLKKYIERQYPGEAARYEGALGQLNKGREELRACSKVDEASKAAALRHVALFAAASRHFPFGETPEDVRCRFVWSGGLPSSAPLDGHDAAVELRSARVAAASGWMAEGAAAFAQDTEAGTKRAAVCFASGAGILAGAAGAPDAALLEAICIAQAQECYVWAAERSGKGGGTVATLAWGAEERFEVAQTMAGQLKQAALAGRLERRRALMYAVAASGEAREEDRSGAKHGEKIGRLLEAARRLKSPGVDQGMEKQAAHYGELIERLTRVHLKENDTIYFQRVGGAGPGAGKVLARPAPPPEEEDPFAGLVAPHVQARAQRYGEWRSMRLQSAWSEAESATEAAQGVLRRHGLPGALEAQESGVPAALRAKAEEVLRAGGEARLKDMRTAKEQLEAEARRLLAAAGTALDEEARLQSAGQTPSQVLTLGLRGELARLGAALEAAAQSDLLVTRKREEMLPLLGKLARLDQALPAPAAQEGGSGGHGELRQTLATLDGLLRERHSLVAALKERARSEQPAGQLTDFSATDEAAFSALYAKNYAGEESKLRDNCQRQNALLESISRLAAALSGAATPRVAACQSLTRACVLFGEVIDNEKEGIVFYTDLQALLMRLLRSAQDFAYARATERSDLAADYGAGAPPPPPYAAAVGNSANNNNNNNYGGYAAAPAPYATHAASAPPPPYNPYGYN